MKILGIDPGTATTGYGVLVVTKNSYEAMDFGLIETDKNGDPEKRLLTIHQRMTSIITQHSPDVIAIEKLFFARNAKTAMRVGQALGVMLFSAAQLKIEVHEYAPGRIKKVIAGSGRADKKDIQKSIRKVLGAGIRSKKNAKTHFDNTADALAVALCHAYHINGSAVEKVK